MSGRGDHSGIRGQKRQVASSVPDDGETELSVWLNWACLGEASTDLRAMDLASRETALHHAMIDCISWVARWTGCREGDVFLTGSATAACDTLLHASAADRPHFILTTDQVFGSIAESARRASRLLRLWTEEDVQTRSLPIGPFLELPSAEFAMAVASAVMDITAGRRSVLIIEHVTSSLGLRLPVDLLAAGLRDSNCLLLIDSAQSVGLWPCESTSESASFGCFHKYLNCPAGTGFGIVGRGISPDLLPAGVVTAARLDSGGHLPTQDADRWITTADHLPLPTPCSVSRDKIRALQAVVLDHLAAIITPSPIGGDEGLRSHIIALELGASDTARLVWQRLEDERFLTKIDGSRIRVSLHHSLARTEVVAFCQSLRNIASRHGVSIE